MLANRNPATAPNRSFEVKHPTMTTKSSDASLRQCLSRFATGITVVTCTDDAARPCGITANSFSSVSLEPPLVLWNIAKSSNSLNAFLETRHFAFHVLSDQQEALSEHFARTDHTRFERIDYTLSASEVPILPDCIAVLHCSTYDTHDCGDHHIIIGKVEHFETRDGDPLLFFGSRYRTIADADQ